MHPVSPAAMRATCLLPAAVTRGRTRMQRSYQLTLAERTRLSADERARLLGLAPARSLADGPFVPHQGDPGDAFWAVLEGPVLVGRFGEAGGFTACGDIGTGDRFGETAFFTAFPRQADAVAGG